MQEWHGLNDQMKGKVERFAKAGYLRWRRTSTTARSRRTTARPRSSWGSSTGPGAVGEIGAAAQHLRSPRALQRQGRRPRLLHGRRAHAGRGALTSRASRAPCRSTASRRSRSTSSRRSRPPSRRTSRRRTTGRRPRRPRRSATKVPLGRRTHGPLPLRRGSRLHARRRSEQVRRRRLEGRLGAHARIPEEAPGDRRRCV